MNKPVSIDVVRAARANEAVRPPRILGIGGTLRAGSSSEQALRMALRAAAARGATTELIPAEALNLPAYDPETAEAAPGANRLVQAVRRADCLIISSPGYHGGVSGLIKNAIDYLQGLADDERPYLQDKAVGCIVSTAGWQAGASTLGSLRATVHALRGWPTPLGVVVNSTTRPFGPDGEALDPKLAEQLSILAAEVTAFACAKVGRAA